MARTHARIYVSIWFDPDFRALTARAQRMYLLLLSQPSVSACGVLSLQARRWSSFAVGSTLESTEAALTELETARFLLIDRETEEVLIRTFVEHDGILKVPNMVIAMWDALELVLSPALREAVREELPEGVAERPAKGSRNPSPKGSGKGSAKGSPNPKGRVPVKTRGRGRGIVSSSSSKNSSRATASEPYDADFALLWEQYPRKVDKTAARKAYIARRHEGIPHDRLVAAVSNYAAAVAGKDPTYTKHGATFLGKDGAWSEWEAGAPVGTMKPYSMQDWLNERHAQ